MEDCVCRDIRCELVELELRGSLYRVCSPFEVSLASLDKVTMCHCWRDSVGLEPIRVNRWWLVGDP